MAGPQTPAQQIKNWLASQEGAMLALIERLVNTDSGSYDKAGVDRSHMGKIERGERNVTILNVGRIAWALDTTPSKLLYDARN